MGIHDGKLRSSGFAGKYYRSGPGKEIDELTAFTDGNLDGGVGKCSAGKSPSRSLAQRRCACCFPAST